MRTKSRNTANRSIKKIMSPALKDSILLNKMSKRFWIEDFQSAWNLSFFTAKKRLSDMVLSGSLKKVYPGYYEKVEPDNV